MVDPRPLWDFSDPETSVARFSALADAAQEPARTAWLTQYARALGLQEKYPEAIAVLDSLTPSGHEASARVQLERGRVLRSRGDQDQARPHFEQAATIAEAGGIDALLIDALHMQALVAPAADQKAITRSRWPVPAPTNLPAIGTHRC